MRAIFLSYRRGDTEGQAGLLSRDLAAEFGADNVFIDVHGIKLGVDFRKVIEKKMTDCGVVLTMIGKNWVDAKDEAGRLRLDDPMDFVRLETASALRRDIPVIPVLVQGARMPQPQQLPEDLKDLAFRNCFELTHARWETDVQGLIEALRSLVADEREEAGGASRGLKPLGQTAGKSTAPNSREAGGGSKPMDEPPPVKRSWRWAIVAAVAALVLAAGAIGAYEYLKAEKANATRAAEEAAEKQAAEDKRVAADKAAADQAAADREAAHKAADQAAAKAAADQAAKDQAAAKAAAAKAAADQAAKDQAAAKAEAAKAAAAVRPSSPSVTIKSATCTALGSGRFSITLSGDAYAPVGDTYGIYVELEETNSGIRWRPNCGSWEAGQPSDGGFWEVGCVHRPNDPPQTSWGTKRTVTTADGQPPARGGIGTFKPGVAGKGPFTSFTLTCR